MTHETADIAFLFSVWLVLVTMLAAFCFWLGRISKEPGGWAYIFYGRPMKLPHCCHACAANRPEMDRPIPWVPITGSDEVGKVVDKHMKQPRCYREHKLCPQSGCDCERVSTGSLPEYSTPSASDPSAEPPKPNSL